MFDLLWRKISTLRRGEKKVDFIKLWDGEISKRFVNERFDDEFALFGENFLARPQSALDF